MTNQNSKNTRTIDRIIKRKHLLGTPWYCALIFLFENRTRREESQIQITTNTSLMSKVKIKNWRRRLTNSSVSGK